MEDFGIVASVQMACEACSGFLKIWNNGLFIKRNQDSPKLIFKSMK